MQGRLLSFISENSPPKSVAKNWLFGNLPRKNRHFMIIGSVLATLTGLEAVGSLSVVKSSRQFRWDIRGLMGYNLVGTRTILEQLQSIKPESILT